MRIVLANRSSIVPYILNKLLECALRNDSLLLTIRQEINTAPNASVDIPDLSRIFGTLFPVTPGQSDVIPYSKV